MPALTKKKDKRQNFLMKGRNKRNSAKGDAVTGGHEPDELEGGSAPSGSCACTGAWGKCGTYRCPNGRNGKIPCAITDVKASGLQMGDASPVR